jgi:hypothetical protein
MDFNITAIEENINGVLGYSTISFHECQRLEEIWHLQLQDTSANETIWWHNRGDHYKDVHSLEVEVKLRPTVIRPVRLGVRHPSGIRDQFFFHLEIFFRQLRVCYFVAPYLTRGWVCNLLLMLVLASAVPLGSESRWTQDHILFSQFLRLFQPGGPGPRIYISQEQGGPDISPGTGFPSVASYDSQGYGGGILSRLHTVLVECSQP